MYCLLTLFSLATVTHDVYTELSKPAVMPAEPQLDTQRANNVREKVSYFTSLMDQQMKSASTREKLPVTTPSPSSPPAYVDATPSNMNNKRASVSGVSAGAQRSVSPQRAAILNNKTLSPQLSPRSATPSSGHSDAPTASPARSPRPDQKPPTAPVDTERMNRLEQENQQLKAQLKALQAENQKLREDNQRLNNTNQSTAAAAVPSVSPREKKTFF